MHALFRVLLTASLLMPATALKAEDFPASDPRITYVGRTLVEGGSVSFDWTGTTIRIAFEGNDLSVRLSDSKKDYFDLWIDSEPSAGTETVIRAQGDTTIVLCDAAYLKSRYGKKIPKIHTAVLLKRTEGEQGKVKVISFSCRNLLQAAPLKERLIEFIGDSYTCGYGAENSIATDKFTPETENVNKTYAAVLGRYFDADIITVAHSGMGINRNYNDKLRGYTMVERYLNVFDNGFDKVEGAPLWTPGNMKPDITVIFLGANDFSKGRQPQKPLYIEDYLRLLKEVVEFYGEDHPVLCVASRTEIFEYVRDAASASGMKNIAICGFNKNLYGYDEQGASSHPAYPAQRKTAHGLIPYISTLTGWPLNDNPIK